MRDKVEKIVSNYEGVGIADIEGTNLFALVFNNKKATEQSKQIAVDINTSCNDKILYSGMIIEDPSDDNVWYGLVDKIPHTQVLYPSK